MIWGAPFSDGRMVFVQANMARIAQPSSMKVIFYDDSATTYTDYVTATTTGKLIITPTLASRFTISAISIMQISHDIETPETSVTVFMQPTDVADIAGTWTELKQAAISTAPVANPLVSRRGVWISSPVEKWEGDVQRNMREIFAFFGQYAATYPLNPAAGVYQHRFGFADPADLTKRIFFTKQYTDIDGVYTHRSCEPHMLNMSGTQGGYINFELGSYGFDVSHVQWIPTATSGPATYNGVIHTRQTSKDTDKSAATWEVQCSAAGPIGDGTTALQSRLAGEPGFGASRLVYNDRPWPIEDQAGAESGIELVFGTGANNSLSVAGPDAWTVSTRGVAPSPTYPSGNTVFVPTNFEWVVEIAGVAPSQAPKTISFDCDRGVRNDDTGWSKDISWSHPARDPISLTGTLVFESPDREWLNRAVHQGQTTLEMTGSGAYITGQVVYRQTMRFYFPVIEVKAFPMNLQQERQRVITVPWEAKPTTPGGIDIIEVEIWNDIVDLENA